MATVKELAKNSALNFLGGIIQAKQDGEQLPKAFDTIATLALNGQQEALILAENEIKKQSMEKLSWIIIAFLAAIIIYLLSQTK